MRRCWVRPVIVMITGRFFAFEGLLMGITEVGREMSNTSVKSEQVRGLGEQGLRKWGEKSALLL